MRLTIPFLALALCLGGCATSQEDLTKLKDTAAALNSEVGNIKGDLVLINDPAQRAKLQERLDQIEPILNKLNVAIQGATTGEDMIWGVLETALAVAVGFFPPAAFAIPLLRSLRRVKKVVVPAIFTSVEAGGGPAKPELAKPVLAAVPEAQAAYQEWKASQP